VDRVFAVAGPFAAAALGIVAAVLGGIYTVGNVGGLLFGASWRASDYATGLIVSVPFALVGVIAARWSGAQAAAFFRCLRCAVRAAGDLETKE
jgi:hypothetical protein